LHFYHRALYEQSKAELSDVSKINEADWDKIFNEQVKPFYNKLDDQNNFEEILENQRFELNELMLESTELDQDTQKVEKHLRDLDFTNNILSLQMKLEFSKRVNDDSTLPQEEIAKRSE
jgi:hypothetical protein